MPGKEKTENEKKCILIIDDSLLNRMIFREMFREEYIVLEAKDGQEGLAVVEQREDELAAILLDIVMPKMDGFQLLEILQARAIVKKVPVFMITSVYSEETCIKAFEMGVMDVVRKPFSKNVTRHRIESVMELFAMRHRLGEEIHEQKQELHHKEKEIQELHYTLIEALAAAIEFRSCEAGEHVNRIYDLTKFILERTSFGEALSAHEREQIAMAAILHDVGKIAIPDHILNKPGKLTKEEFEIMKQHTVLGYELLESISRIRNSTLYGYAYDICRHHHERWDGKGYPDGLRGEEISPWAQIVGLADVYDALTSERVYKPSYTHEESVHMILNGECGKFNPKLMEVFSGLQADIKVLMAR